MILYGADWCPGCRALKEKLDIRGISYEYKNVDDPETGKEHETLVSIDVPAGKKGIPTLKIGDKVQVYPDEQWLIQNLEGYANNTDVAAKNTLDGSNEVLDVLMIGAGPASLTAAIYTTREDLNTVLYEKGVVGGLASITDWVDNYPGFPDGISGMELGENLRKQAERFGAKIELGEVLAISKEDKMIKVSTTDGDRYAKTVLIATGSDYKRLGVTGEDEYYARGVHFCATCDGAFYRDKRLVVVGGGNSAVQEAIFLTKFANHIDLLVRSDKMRASEVLQEDLKKYSDVITVHYSSSTDEIVGDGKKVTGVKSTTNGEQRTIETDGVFVFIGLLPNTKFLGTSGVELDEIGLIKTNLNLETSVSGVFAAGDVRSGATMQIASAVGEGSTAALRIREYLDEHFK